MDLPFAGKRLSFAAPGHAAIQIKRRMAAVSRTPR